MKEILLRLKAPLNTFWRRFRAVMVVVSAVSLTVTQAIEPYLLNQYLPEWALKVLQHAYMFGTFGILIAQLTVRDTTELKKEKSEAA